MNQSENKTENTGTSFNQLAQKRPAESNTIEIPSISLPNGVDALKGIDEKQKTARLLRDTDRILEAFFPKWKRYLEKGIYWKAGDTLPFLGYIKNARIDDSKDEDRIFEWIPELSCCNEKIKI